MRTAIPVTVIALLAGCAWAQAPAFEVASVKPSPPVKPGERVYYGPARGGPGTPDPTQITWAYARFLDLLMTAYDVQLGLRLVASKATLDVIVIDRAEKIPTAN